MTVSVARKHSWAHLWPARGHLRLEPPVPRLAPLRWFAPKSFERRKKKTAFEKIHEYDDHCPT